jgi:hypothetical protein
MRASWRSPAGQVAHGERHGGRRPSHTALRRGAEAYRRHQLSVRTPMKCGRARATGRPPGSAGGGGWSRTSVRRCCAPPPYHLATPPHVCPPLRPPASRAHNGRTGGSGDRALLAAPPAPPTGPGHLARGGRAAPERVPLTRILLIAAAMPVVRSVGLGRHLFRLSHPTLLCHPEPAAVRTARRGKGDQRDSPGPPPSRPPHHGGL